MNCLGVNLGQILEEGFNLKFQNSPSQAAMEIEISSSVSQEINK